jgi:hypothetical protein
MIRKTGLMALLLLALSASIFLVSVSIASAQDASSGESNTVAQNDEPTDTAVAQGIWKASLGNEEIAIAINQSGQSLFGLAKFEGEDPWNAAVAGSISDSEVSLSLAALRSDALASICISASLQGKTMKGFFIESDSNGMASRGDFTAEMISQNLSGYSPALTATAQKKADETEKTTADQTAESSSGEVSKKTAQLQSDSRFKDVTKLAKGINPDILPRMASL